jgi:glucans biosynthesis protein
MWEPAHIPQAGDRIEFSYRQHWTTDPDPSLATGHVVATRSGIHDWQPGQRTIIVEFKGTSLQQNGEIPITPQIEAIGENGGKVVIQGVNLQQLPDERWRLAFQVAPSAEGSKLSDIGPIELRCCLKRGDNYLTETWVHRITP